MKKYRISLKTKGLLIFLLLFEVVMFFLAYNLFPQINLNGNSETFINYKEIYKDPGYSASFFSNDVTDKVKVSGNVDSSKLGDYVITYEYGDFFRRKVKRVVHVADLSKPTIDFKNQGDIYICPGDKFKGVEVTAFDNYDGDLTDRVVVKENNDNVLFSVIDSSGNKIVKSKKLFYKDVEKPKIELLGGNSINLYVNSSFKDPGFKAFDNCDGDISSSVKVENNILTDKLGDYVVKYNVVDKANNEFSIERSVHVIPRPKTGVIYLTFDDGPHVGTTDVILDILKEENVKATFFVTGVGPDYLIKREYDEGHSIGLHTYTHNYADVYASVDSYFNDLNKISDRVYRITGERSKIIRFPGGSSNTISRRYSRGIMTELTKKVVDMGYKYYDWNLSSGDASGRRLSSKQIEDNVIGSLRRDRTNVVLMHDIKYCTRDALRNIIRYGKNNGYEFEKITINTEMVRQRVNN